jgi:Family of unknown function (DUF6467)
MKDHPSCIVFSHPNPVKPGRRFGLAGSLTGAVACSKVTQASKGTLSPDGNRVVSAIA